MEGLMLVFDILLAPMMSKLIEGIKKKHPKIDSKQVVLMVSILLAVAFAVISHYIPDLTLESAIGHAGLMSASSMQFYNFFIKYSKKDEASK